ncbi:MAG: DUF554 family protein [Eubacteriales bacterium]|nr:DUF554 family protein [Eubacteriales bacterium]
MYKYFGTIVNSVAIIIASLIGTVSTKFHITKKDDREPLSSAILVTLGLCTILASVSGLVGLEDGVQSLKCVISLTLGYVIGYLLDIDGKIFRVSSYFKNKFSKSNSKESDYSLYGFINATLIFCIGSFVILGPLQASQNTGDNLVIEHHILLLMKSLFDFTTSLFMSMNYGISILFSSIPVLLIQGAITILATSISPFIVSHNAMPVINCVGSVVLLTIAFNFIFKTKIKTADFIPCILLSVIICAF